MGCFLDDLRAFGINAEQWTTAPQDEEEWCRTAEQGAEHFMAKWIVARAISIILFFFFLMPLFLAKHGLFLVIMLLHMLLFGGYAFGYALFFGVTYAPKRRLCSCICYFSVLMPYIMLGRPGGSVARLGERARSRTFTHVQHILFWLYQFFTEVIITFFDAHLYLRVGAPAWIETRHYVLPWCRGALWYVLLCCWLLTARCSSRPLFSVCCVLGCVRAVFLCLLFLQIADVDVFFCVLLFIGACFRDK